VHPIHPDRGTVCRATENGYDTYGDEIRTGELYYEFDNGTEAPKSQIKAKRIFHLRGLGDGPVGLNVYEYAAESIGWARAAQLFGSAFFGNGMNPAGVVINKKPLKTPGALERQKEEFDNLFRGPARSHKTAHLDNDADWKPISFNARESQLIPVHQHLVEEICRWFGAPPHKVQHLLNAHFTNIEHQNIEVVQDSVQPWTKRLEDEADYKLFGVQNRNSLYTKINLRGLLRGDFKGQNDALEVMRKNAVINADEWLEYLDMPRQPGGSGGDKYILQAQWTEQSKVGLIPEPMLPAPPEEPEEDDDQPTDEDAEAMQRVIDLQEAAHA
jgi:HK97 family phage portal protein